MSEKRAYQRKPVNIKANIVYDNEMYSSMVTNISEIGAYIETGSRLPLKLKYKLFFNLKPNILVFINFKSKSLQVTVKIRRWLKVDKQYNGIGVEVLNPTEDYFSLVNSH